MDLFEKLAYEVAWVMSIFKLLKDDIGNLLPYFLPLIRPQKHGYWLAEVLVWALFKVWFDI